MSRHLIVSLFAFLALCAGASGATLRAINLRCEYHVDPIAITEAAPRLGWTLESTERSQKATAYRILVASTPELLEADTGDLWDTGRVDSNQTVHIEYRGSPLRARQRCHWKVMAWNSAGNAGSWSEPARWEMGLHAPEDWSASWIEASPRPLPVEITRATYATVDGSVRVDVTNAVRALQKEGRAIVASNDSLGGDPAKNIVKQLILEYTSRGVPMSTTVPENSAASIASSSIPYLRRAFTIDKPIKAAKVYATSLGLYELTLNGERIGDHSFAPGWTDYRKRVQYQTFDVTKQVASGKNVIGGIVAPGWFSGRAGLFHAREFYGKTPALLVQLEIEFTDGTSQRVVSDDQWKRHDGPILAADMMDGEMYHAPSAIRGWDTVSFDDSSWANVSVCAERRNLESQPDRPVRVLEERPAQSVTEPAPGRWTFDIGQNIVGVARLRIRAAAGTVITIRHAEMLKPDGTIYTENLRGAKAEDTYICSGTGEEVWQPRFTFHGFRYVEVTGVGKERPDARMVTGIVIGSDLEQAGTFECSDARLNQLHSNIVWGLRGNYLSIPTDCPQRDERMGWMADTQVFTPTAAFNADVAQFMHKWMTDVRDAQREDGAHSDVAPVMKGLNYGTPAWADAGTIVPWTIYQMYGDVRVLERNIDSMIRWVEWCREHSTGLIRAKDRGNDYGDWLSIDADTPKDLIGTAYFARSAEIVAQSLRVLGREQEAAQYAQLHSQVRDAFIKRYVTAEGLVHGRTQCGYVLALRFNLLPPDLRNEAMAHLIEDIRSRGWRLSTGFVGVGNLLPVLSDGGEDSAAYRLLMQDAFPSWLFSVEHGATTIWERWNGWTPGQGVHPDASMNSFNHYSLGSCGEWLYSGVCGIEPDASHPGFAKFSVRPRIGGSLSWAKATFRSVHGTIESSWKEDDGKLSLRVVVPVNTMATIYVPAKGGNVSESGRPLAAAEGVRLLRNDANMTVVEVGSGTYEFEADGVTRTTGNPVLPGWYADPEAIVIDGKYWIYPTFSAPYDQQTFFDAFSSDDLVSWTRHPRILDTSRVTWAKRAMWAPSLIEKNGKYYLFFGANDIQSDREHGGIGVAVSDSPAGPFSDHLGKPLVDAFHNGAQPIDQFVFRDVDGADYLIYGGWKHCNIARLKPDYTGFEPFADGATFKEITPEKYVEGPFMFVRKGRYYFMWSEGGWTGPDYSVAYAIGDSPTGPFTRIGTVLKQNPDVATGAGHHSVIQVPGKDQYFIVYHRRPLSEKDRNHRIVCIDRMEFDDAGLIQPVKITHEGISPP